MLGFFLNDVGELKGLLLPSNYRIFDIKKLISGTGIFLMENRNCLGNKKGLLSAIVPKDPIIGSITKCEMIVVVDLCQDNKGCFVLNYRKLKQIK